MFTPLQITMMLHYYVMAEPYAIREQEHANSEAVLRQRKMLCEHGLLEVDRSTNPCSGYNVTEKGKVYIDALTNVPVPVCKWVIE